MSCLVTSTTLLLSVSTSTSKFSISSFHYSIPNDLFHSFSLSRVLPLPLTAEQLPAVSSRIMWSPQPHLNGGETRQHFHSTVSLQKLKRFNSLILVFRFSGFCFTLASAVFMLTTSRVSDSLHWYNFDAFRYVFAANAIVSVYSLFEMTATVWEISRNATLLPEICQVWFDFSHDQVFAYLLLSANSAGTEMARAMKGTCTDNNAFCVQSDIAIALGFVGFLFLGVSSLLSGFRVVCFIINGSRFYV